MYSDRPGMFFLFLRYLHISDPTQFGWDMGPSMQAHSMHACKLACSGQIMCSERSSIFFWFHIYFDLSDLTQLGWDTGPCMQAHSMHECKLVCLGPIMCSERSSMSPDYIDTLISLMQPHLSELWVCASKNIGCMHASLCAQDEVCAQRGLAWSPDSIDTLISLIHSNLAEIWAHARKHIACMHAILR